MKKHKILIGFLTSCLMFLGFNVSVFAEGEHTESSFLSEEINLDTIETSDDMEISDPMTYEEIVLEYANDFDMSIEEAKAELQPDNQLFSAPGLYANNYRTLTQTLTVTSAYKPQLKFYCQTSESSGSFRGIKKIMTVNMNRNYRGKSYTFGGSVYTHLRDANRIFYIVNGDFYRNGTTTVNGGVNIPIGGKATVSFGASYTSDHFKYFYKEGTRYW